MSEAEDRHYLVRMNGDALGNFGEALWSAIFREAGIHYIPLSKINQCGAPRLSEKGDVLPDFDVMGPDFTAYIDSKAKTKSVLFKKWNQLRHGIDRRNWEHYQNVAAIARKDCGLGIVELESDETNAWTGAILLQSLTKLSTPFFGINEPKPKVYWPRRSFVLLAELPASELLAIARSRVTRNYRDAICGVFGPPKEPPPSPPTKKPPQGTLW